MTEEKLIYGDILTESWNAVRSQLALVVGLSLVFSLGIGIAIYLPIIGNAIMSPFALGYLRCLLQIRKGEVIGYRDFFWGFLEINRFIHSLLLGLLISLGYIGFLFLIVPGIWWVVVSAFANIFFMMGTEDCIESLKKSINLVQGRWWNVAGFLGALGLLNFAGAICFAVGWLFTLPVTTLALYIAVEKLLLSAPPKIEILTAQEPVTVV